MYNAAITLLLNAEDTQVQRDFYERVLTAIVESVPGVCVDMWREMLTEWQTKGELVPNPFNASRSRMYVYFFKDIQSHTIYFRFISCSSTPGLVSAGRGINPVRYGLGCEYQQHAEHNHRCRAGS